MHTIKTTGNRCQITAGFSSRRMVGIIVVQVLLLSYVEDLRVGIISMKLLFSGVLEFR
jgi:hypothetical protein